MAYKGSTELISGLIPKNGIDIALLDWHNINVTTDDGTDTRLDSFLENFSGEGHNIQSSVIVKHGFDTFKDFNNEVRTKSATGDPEYRESSNIFLIDCNDGLYFAKIVHDHDEMISPQEMSWVGRADVVGKIENPDNDSFIYESKYDTFEDFNTAMKKIDGGMGNALYIVYCITDGAVYFCIGERDHVVDGEDGYDHQYDHAKIIGQFPISKTMTPDATNVTYSNDEHTDQISVQLALDDIYTKLDDTTFGDIDASKVPYANTANQEANTVALSLSDIYQKIEDMNYKAITLTMSVIPSTAEIGSAVTDVTITWNTSKKPKTLEVNGVAEDVTLKSKKLEGVNITKDTSYSVKVTDERDTTVTKNASVTFLNGVYYGVSTVDSTENVDNAMILGLTKKLASNRTGEVTVNAGNNEYIYYAIPSTMGIPEFIVNGFSGGFGKAPFKTFEFTNASKHTVSYDVWRSDNKGLGTTKVIIK